MAYPRSDQFNESQTWLADIARALSHPARLAILDILARREDCICGELVDELPLAQATISQHLKVLKDAGLIEGKVDGPKTCYCVNTGELDRVATTFSEWFDGIRTDRMCC